MVARERIFQETTPTAELTHEERVAAFVHGAGIRYGLVFGILYALLTFVYNGLSLALASADGYWVSAAIGIPIALVLCVIAGRLAARPQAAWLSYVIWSGTLVVLAVLAIHLPFDGVNAFWGFMDPTLSGITLYPFGVSAEYRMVLLAAASAVLGLATAFLEQVAMSWAWDRSTDDFRMTRGGWVSLGIAALPIIVLFIVTDGLVNNPLRTPLVEVNGVVRYILHASRDPKELMRNAPKAEIPYYGIALNRDSFTEHFTEYLVGYDLESLNTTQVDVAFDNGFILRCNTSEYGNFVGPCGSLLKDYGEWMNQLMWAGDINCNDCGVQVNAPTRLWLKERLPELPKEYKLTATHGPGPIVYVQAWYDPVRAIQCRFRGRAPTIIDICRDLP